MIKKFKEIKRNKDDEGRILTYTVVDKFNFEYNTLKEARVMARIIE